MKFSFRAMGHSRLRVAEPAGGARYLPGAQHGPTQAASAAACEIADTHERVELAALLAELAHLHARVAEIHQRLAQEAGNQLARCRALRLMDDVSPLKPEELAQSGKRDGLLTKKQVAELLGCHPRTVRRMELEGELPGAVTKGRLKRWRKQSVLEWLEDTPRSNRRGAR